MSEHCRTSSVPDGIPVMSQNGGVTVSVTSGKNME